MSSRHFTTCLLVVTTLAAGAPTVRAQEPSGTGSATATDAAKDAAAQEPPPSAAAQPSSAKKNKQWAFTITPDFWLSSVSAKVDGDPVSESLGELASVADFGGMLRADLRWKRLTFSADGLAAQLSQTDQVGPASVKAQLDQTLVDLRIGYVVLDKRDGMRGPGTVVSVDIGARYWDMDVELDLNVDTPMPIPPISRQAQGTESWWDPMVGARANFGVTDVVSFVVAGSVGGFGIGDASDFTWDLTAIARFQTWKHVGFDAGYRVLGFNRTSGGGQNPVTTDLTLSGPILGLNISF